ncbi:Rho GTPase activating protein 10 [Cichlidogyrus casuarinus]|uniref:Rho GTPase activating protein 10 n=1 Tax=Cichlidogyrus casuarinus TaxID=1844966 RepID=A0ABD2Q2Y6_9PLAT
MKASRFCHIYVNLFAFQPVQAFISSELSTLRSEFLDIDAKGYVKESINFTSKVEKFLASKQKESCLLGGSEEQMEKDRKAYMSTSFNYISKVQEAEDHVKFDFIRNMCLFMHTLRGFYRSALLCYDNAQKTIDDASLASQEIINPHKFEQSFNESKDAKANLKNSVLLEPWEKIGPTESYSGREGYLYVYHKKPVASNWSKYFCIFHKDNKQFQMIHYSPGKSTDFTTENYKFQYCTKKTLDPTIERRFCFEVYLEGKPLPMVMQAQSAQDFNEWTSVLDGKDPVIIVLLD